MIRPGTNSLSQIANLDPSQQDNFCPHWAQNFLPSTPAGGVSYVSPKTRVSPEQTPASKGTKVAIRASSLPSRIAELSLLRRFI
ncbi:hypothetical protein PtB15_16B113 [Puccinia triticina]|nr:hypothetical protein PtB15_16B113 [Puccinia triticina]